MSVHPSVVNIDMENASSPSCVGTLPEGGHAAHDGSCLFAKSSEYIRVCAFGPNSGDPVCPTCVSWPSQKRIAYRNSLIRLAKSSSSSKPQCWTSVLESVLLPGRASAASRAPRVDESSSSSSPSTPQDILRQLQSPELLRALTMLQSPAMQAMVANLNHPQQDQGSEASFDGSHHEDQEHSSIQVIQWALDFHKDMLHTSSSVTPGSFSFQDHAVDFMKLRGDTGVIGAFLRGLNVHKSLPPSACLPDQVISALGSASSSSSSHRPYSGFKPMKASMFHFENQDLLSLLARDSASTSNIPVHQDWGGPSSSSSSSVQWSRASEGLALQLEAAALVDLLAKLEGDHMDSRKSTILQSIRSLVVASASLFGTFGHDVLKERRESFLDRIKPPNKAVFMQEPYLPGHVVGAQATTCITQPRDPSRALSEVVTQLSRSVQSSARGRVFQSSSFSSSYQRRPHRLPFRGQGRRFGSSFRGRNLSRGSSRGRGSKRQSSSQGPPAQKKRF